MKSRGEEEGIRFVVGRVFFYFFLLPPVVVVRTYERTEKLNGCDEDVGQATVVGIIRLLLHAVIF